jgi:glycosyltransferase involved in cell wall biosynthesis
MKANLFVSASDREGMPIAVLEAMACQCPVVLSDIPPHREIADGEDFIPLIAPDDAEGFAKEIKRIRNMDRFEKLELGRKCRKLVERRFSLAAMHKNYARLYEQLLKRNN